MKYLLGHAHVDRLEALARSDVLLVFDFDGTLAPITPHRDKARMRRRTQELFERVCQRYPCAIVSGRGREDVARRVAGHSVRYIVGNHGMENDDGPLAVFQCQIAMLKPVLAARLHGMPGIDIEDKHLSLSVHYRHAPQPEAAVPVIHQLLDDLPVPVRIVPGHCVVNVLPAGAPNKGDAVVALRARAGVATVFYAGDDSTDEDVFLLDQPDWLLTARIGRLRESAAAYYLRDQREMDTLLLRLARLRAGEEAPSV